MTNKKGPEFSESREARVLLEDLHSQFRVFVEGLGDVRNRLERVENKVDGLDQKVECIDLRLIGVESKVDGLESKVDGLGDKVDRLEVEMAFVRKVLPTVATKDDLKQLEKRLTKLETAH